MKRRSVVAKVLLAGLAQILMGLVLYRALRNNRKTAAIFFNDLRYQCCDYRKTTFFVTTPHLRENRTEFSTRISSFIFERNKNMLDVNCEGIMNGNNDAIQFTKKKELRTRAKNLRLPDEVISSWTRNCSSYKLERKYITTSMSDEEENYPLAYIISLYTDLQAFEHLLRSIYHPQNVYCIHIDEKSDILFKERVLDIVRCFDNVFVASKLIKVYYAHWSIVQSSLNCMEDLIKVKRTWKYVMNLCGFDYPIKTNLGIVRALKKFGGLNSATTFDFKNRPEMRDRYNQKYRIPIFPLGHDWLVPTGVKKNPAPHNITIFTGSDYIAFRREAVEFLLNDKIIHDFLKWAEDTSIPDEMVWPTLQRMYPRFPGSEPQDGKYNHEEYEALPRFRIWRESKRRCAGKFVRHICIFASGDLSRFPNDHHIFANKLRFDVDPYALECLAEYIRNKTIRDALS